MLTPRSTPVPTIVVAVDDSEPTDSADLRIAAEEARRRGGRIRAVHGCATLSPGGLIGASVTEERVRYGQYLLAQARKVLRGLAGAQADITSVNSRELGSDALLAESTTAALVILIHTRTSRLRSMADVAASLVAARAQCPVLLVHPGDTPGTGPGVVMAADDLGLGGALLRQAAAEAVSRDMTLTVVHPWQPVPDPGTRGLSRLVTDSVAEDIAREELTVAVLDLAVDFPTLSITPRLVRGPVLDALEEASLGASLLVVGRPAGWEVATSLTGMPGALAARARCPLLVMPTSLPAGTSVTDHGPSFTLEETRPRTTVTSTVTSTDHGLVVVAVDRSGAGRAALGWAAGYARTVGADLRAVHVLSGDVALPVSVAAGLLTTSGPLLAQVRTGVRDLFDSIAPEPSWTIAFLEGPTGPSIVDEARGARLLVVGMGQHHGVGRLLHASVSHYCVTHAGCPVVAVPAPQEGTTGVLTASGVGDSHPALS